MAIDLTQRLTEGVSFSIVTFETWERTTECLRSIAESLNKQSIHYEILVCDNGRSRSPVLDPSWAVDVCVPGANLGFGAGHNMNLHRAKYSLFFILNPDTTLADASVLELVRVLNERPYLSAAAPLLVNGTGSETLSVRRFPSMWTELGRLFGLDRGVDSRWSTLMSPGTEAERIAPQPAGAALMVRTGQLLELGGFDAEFPLYFEDVDLCARLSRMGAIIECGTVRVIHDTEGTARSYRKETTFWIEYSRRRYYRKHWSGIASYIVRALAGVSAFEHGVLLLTLSLMEGPNAEELRAKGKGYLLSVVSMFFGSGEFWRRKMLPR